MNNLNGLTLHDVNFTWLHSNSIWDPRTKRIYQYNSNSSLIEYITQKWDANINQFINTDKLKLSYNSNQDIDTFLFLSWDTLSNLWVNRTQFISKYDNQHNEIESEQQEWDITTKSWKKESLFKYSYDQNNNIILIIEYQWLNNNWIELYKSKQNNTYDIDLNLIKVINQDWDTTSYTFINYDKVDYFYSKHDIISNTESKEKSTIKIYPNPCQDFITINGMTSSSNLSLFDLQSNQIQVKNDNDRIDLSNLNSGIYLPQDSKGK
ncbi:MAG: T9SS type A sorting domain-containing protein [Saprospiraceae bacterium]|nr:T9SS type A sorting domain-containing protein [Saprospiraceae bacterium]